MRWLLALPLASGLVLNHAPLLRSSSSHETGHPPVLMGGKGFGGGEATRDPAPTTYDLNDPKGKQQAIHKAESFSDYLARRGSVTAEAVCPHAAAAPAASLPYVPLAAPAPFAAPAPAVSRDYLGNAPIQGARSTATADVAHSAGPSVDYAAVRRELTLLMDNPSWDDGSLAPVFIRLAWHSSGTYDQASNTGGSNGAGMRYETEAADPENAGLAVARAFLEPVKRRFPAMSYSDLWILAAYVGIEHTGGPAIEFTAGRTDHEDEGYWAAMSNNPAARGGVMPAQYGRLPAAEKYTCPHLQGDLGANMDDEGRVVGWEGLCTHVRNEVFYRMGFGDREIVALLCGGHVYGRCHPGASGYAGPWVDLSEGNKFTNEYAADMIEDEWRLVDHSDTWLDDIGAAELRPAPGNRQYVNQKPPDGSDEEQPPNQMMLVSDMILAWDPAFRSHLEVYAEDEELLVQDFAVAFKKLTELGCGFA